MSWNYRILRRDDGDGGSFFAIHEVFYGEAGEAKGISERPAAVCGDSEQELREVLAMMLAALDHPEIDEKSFRARWVLQDDEKLPSAKTRKAMAEAEAMRGKRFATGEDIMRALS